VFGIGVGIQELFLEHIQKLKVAQGIFIEFHLLGEIVENKFIVVYLDE
jgi:hypothetical protein